MAALKASFPGELSAVSFLDSSRGPFGQHKGWIFSSFGASSFPIGAWAIFLLFRPDALTFAIPCFPAISMFSWSMPIDSADIFGFQVDCNGREKYVLSLSKEEVLMPFCCSWSTVLPSWALMSTRHLQLGNTNSGEECLVVVNDFHFRSYFLAPRLRIECMGSASFGGSHYKVANSDSNCYDFDILKGRLFVSLRKKVIIPLLWVNRQNFLLHGLQG